MRYYATIKSPDGEILHEGEFENLKAVTATAKTFGETRIDAQPLEDEAAAPAPAKGKKGKKAK